MCFSLGSFRDLQLTTNKPNRVTHLERERERTKPYTCSLLDVWTLASKERVYGLFRPAEREFRNLPREREQLFFQLEQPTTFRNMYNRSMAFTSSGQAWCPKTLVLQLQWIISWSKIDEFDGQTTLRNFHFVLFVFYTCTPIPINYHIKCSRSLIQYFKLKIWPSST